MLPRMMAAMGALALTAWAGAAEPVFFRSDFGLPRAHDLPDNFESAPKWRTEIDPGHSTPIYVNGSIYLTTARVAERELATVAVDTATGEVKWKEVVPVEKIEEFHPQEGTAAMATPASDGERLYVFFWEPRADLLRPAHASAAVGTSHGTVPR